MGLGYSLFSQKIVKAEYFINDSDLGFGKNTLLSIAPTDQNTNMAIELNVPLSTIETGMHSLYIRVQDENKRWSIASQLPFQVIHLPVNTVITKAEYFIAELSEGKNGTDIAIVENTSNITLSPVLDLSELSAGVNTLFIRVKDNYNRWSLLNSTIFYLIPSDEIAKVKSFEYYFEGSNGNTQTYTFNNFTPGIIVELNDADFLANASGLEYDNQYKLHIRALNNNGRYSGYSTLQFTFKLLGTGIDNQDFSRLTMYPNPASDFLYLKGGESVMALDYYIYNIQGQSIENGKVEGSRINLRSLPAGNYILVIKEGNTLYKGDLFVKK